MPINFKNLWGASVARGGVGLDIQRSDLWTLDLSEAQEASLSGDVRNLIPVLQDYVPGFSAEESGDLSNLVFYPKSVSFPEVRLQADVVSVYSTPTNFPGADEAIPQVRIVFRHPTAEAEGLSTLSHILTSWQELCRFGRGTRYSDPYGSKYGYLLRAADQYKIPYKYDLTLRLYQGNTYADTDVQQMVPSNTYILKGAWISGLQIGDLDYEGSVPLTITATFYVENIVQGRGLAGESAKDFWNSGQKDPGIVFTPSTGGAGGEVTKPAMERFNPSSGGDIPAAPPTPEPPSVPAKAAVDMSIPVWENWDFWNRWK